LGSTKGGQGTIGKVTDNGNGTYTATFTGTIAGANTIVATIGGAKVTTSPPSITVTPGPYSLTKSVVSVSKSTVVSGGTVTVTLQTKDAAGNDLATNLLTGGGTVLFQLVSATGGGGTFGTVTYLGNGEYQATFTASSVGSNSIMALIDNAMVTSSPPKIKVTA
jgi:adhesin/invasin